MCSTCDLCSCIIESALRYPTRTGANEGVSGCCGRYGGCQTKLPPMPSCSAVAVHPLSPREQHSTRQRDRLLISTRPYLNPSNPSPRVTRRPHLIFPTTRCTRWLDHYAPPISRKTSHPPSHPSHSSHPIHPLPSPCYSPTPGSNPVPPIPTSKTHQQGKQSRTCSHQEEHIVSARSHSSVPCSSSLYRPSTRCTLRAFPPCSTRVPRATPRRMNPPGTPRSLSPPLPPSLARRVQAGRM